MEGPSSVLSGTCMHMSPTRSWDSLTRTGCLRAWWAAIMMALTVCFTTSSTGVYANFA